MFETTATYHRLTPEVRVALRPRTSRSSDAPAAHCAQLNSSYSSQRRHPLDGTVRQLTTVFASVRNVPSG